MQKVVGSNPISRFGGTVARTAQEGERSGGDHHGTKARNQHRFHRCGAGQRHLLGHRASRPGGPRPHVLGRRQADDRLRGVQRGESGGGSAGWQGSRRSAPLFGTSPSPSPATTPTARSTRASPATAGRRPTSAVRANGVALQADGKIVVVGSHPTAASPSPATTPTARSTRASLGTASRPPTWGLTTRRPEWRSRETARSSSSAPHGLYRRESDFALARYNPNGSLDTSFSGDGKQTTDFGAHPRRSERCGDPGRRQDRRGRRPGQSAPRATSPSPATTRTARSTRASPAMASRRPTSAATTRRPRWRSRRRQDRRRRRRESGATGGDFALARYNPNGTLDTSFSGDGKQTTGFGATSTRPTGSRSRATARSSRSACGGTTTSLSPATTPTARSTRASPATASETTDFGGNDSANAVAIQANGKIVAVGGSERRLRATTSPSPATTPTARSTRASPATASRRPTSAGMTRRTGWRSRQTARSSWSAAAAQSRRHRLRARPLQPDGSLDTTFSGDGKQTTDFGGVATRRRTAVAIQATARSSSVGDAAGPMAPSDFALARYNPTAPSTRASPATASRRPTSSATDEALGVGDPGRRQDRRGRHRRRHRRRALRLRARPLQPRTARLDTTFSGDGKQTTDFGRTATANGVAIQADGKIVVGGRRGRRRQRHDFALARYNADGSLDTTFAATASRRPTSAAATRRPGSRSRPTARSSRRAWPTRRSGRLRARPLQRRRLARHDLRRRRQGATDFGVGADDAANGVAIQADGKIVAAGAPAAATGSDFALARYNADGTLDTSFSGDGKQTTSFGGADGATGWRSRATARSSRSGVASVSTKPATSRSPAISAAHWPGFRPTESGDNSGGLECVRAPMAPLMGCGRRSRRAVSSP